LADIYTAKTGGLKESNQRLEDSMAGQTDSEQVAKRRFDFVGGKGRRPGREKAALISEPP
jgi:hypothetical protein